jgi:plasmid stabilization system protein ParE
MKVVWQESAKVGRREVAAYIRKEFGIKRVKRFRQEIDDVVTTLMRSPNIGSIDPLYANRPLTYRSVIVNGLNKIVYRIDGDIIYIVDFWDTRREPKNQAKKTT